MADEEAAAPQQSEAAEKKGLPIKTIIIVAVMLIGEGALIAGAMILFGSPSKVVASGAVGEVDPGEELTELPVLHEKFTNTSTGRVWVWDTEVLLVTRARHEERVKESLEQHNAMIRTGVGGVIAAANHQFFNEPNRPTLTRQTLEYLRKIIGQDEATGDELIVDVLIPSCTGFPTDY